MYIMTHLLELLLSLYSASDELITEVHARCTLSLSDISLASCCKKLVCFLYISADCVLNVMAQCINHISSFGETDESI